MNMDPQRMKQMQDRFKEEQKKNNNPIELKKSAYRHSF